MSTQRFLSAAVVAAVMVACGTSGSAEAAGKAKRNVVLSPEAEEEPSERAPDRARDTRGGSSAVAASKDDDDASEPAITTSRRRPRKAEPAAEASSSPASSDSSSDDEPAVEQDRAGSRAGSGAGTGLFVGIGVGSGGGYAGPAGIEAYGQYVRNYRPGLAREGYGHAVPEIGWFFTPSFALSLQTRHQYIPTVDTYSATGAHAVLARALFFTGEGSGRFYGSLAAGGGSAFRLTVRAASKQGTVITDTVRGGPVVAGAGGGFSYAFNSTIWWMLEVNTLAGFPYFSVAVDVNTGLRFRL